MPISALAGLMLSSAVFIEVFFTIPLGRCGFDLQHPPGKSQYFILPVSTGIEPVVRFVQADLHELPLF